jgi:hypothetical protein
LKDYIAVAPVITSRRHPIGPRRFHEKSSFGWYRVAQPMTQGDNQARLGAVNDQIEPDEAILFDVLALLLDPGYGLKAREAEGYLVLSDRRLIFGTAEHGVLINVTIGRVERPTRICNRLLMARLLVSLNDDTSHTFVINKRSARAIARSINGV